jgi:glycosyltransferase involved in cell wall biosynthesis
VNVLAAATVIGRRVRDARTLFVCAASASNGFGAVLSGRPYGCWISTTLAEESTSRQGRLATSRRLAHAASEPGLRALERRTIREAHVRWTISPSSQRAVVRATGIPADTIRVVPIPVDSERFTPLPDDEWEARLEAPELIFVGRADDPRKNVRLLLKAFSSLRRQLPTATLKLVGSRPSLPLPPGVEATGHVASVPDVLRGATLFVLPSLQEGFGIVVAEALASGVPVLVTPCGGPEELVRDSHGGEVLSGFDANDLSERALALLGQPERLRKMRRLGRGYVEREHNPARLATALGAAVALLDAAG